MAVGLLSKKCGMTRIFSADGKTIPVTVIAVLPQRIVQVKNLEKDGYYAIQVTCGVKKTNKVNKATTGHYIRANVNVGEGLWEFSLAKDECDKFTVGQELGMDKMFAVGTLVDVQGTTKGKGFAGVIKRHHFAGGRASHGNSLSHRAPGSIGQRQTPGRVFKGKKMAGHLGNAKRTIQSQEIVQIDSDRNLIMIKGGVPGAPGSYVVVQPTIKQRRARHGV